MKYNIVEIIEKKINKGKLTEEEIEYFVDGYTKGDIKDYQAASLVTAIMINGLNIDETYFLTKSSINFILNSLINNYFFFTKKDEKENFHLFKQNSFTLF